MHTYIHTYSFGTFWLQWKGGMQPFWLLSSIPIKKYKSINIKLKKIYKEMKERERRQKNRQISPHMDSTRFDVILMFVSQSDDHSFDLPGMGEAHETQISMG